MIKGATLKRYNEACKRLFHWVKSTGRPWPRNRVAIDNLVCEFVESCWEEGEPRSVASDTISGLQHTIPSLKRHLAGCWRLLGAWQRHELPARAPPLTEQILWALAGFFLRQGWDDMAICIWVAFHCLLRTGEMIQLLRQDVHIADDLSKGVVNLGVTKSGARLGTKESVTILDKRLLPILMVYLSRLKQGDKLLQRTQAEFRNKFAQGLRALHIEEWEFKPYSLRRGGATAHFLENGTLSSTTVRGRWGNARTARVYINEAAAVMASISNSVTRNKSVKDFEKYFKYFISTGKR